MTRQAQNPTGHTPYGSRIFKFGKMAKLKKLVCD